MPFTLLIVDDEPTILAAMREYFEVLGWRVDCATSAAEALPLLERGGYAVLIADLRLDARRGEEGLWLIEAARARSPAIRTLLLTAYGSPEVEERARNLGVDVFLHKPQRLQCVAETVSRLRDLPARAAPAN
jgi:two-component system NtrC family response regulator/two-component system response regulator HydG